MTEPSLPNPLHVKNTAPLYQQIGQALAQLIHSGSIKTGQRLPSVRQTAITHGVSLSTATQAYRQLEEQGLVQAKAKAGFFVRRPPRLAALSLSTPPQRSLFIERQTRSEGFASLHRQGDLSTFGGFSPQSNLLFDSERLRVAMGRASRIHRHSLTEYNIADAGRLALRQAIARRALHLGCSLDAAHIVTTASCTHGVSLCLQAVTVPGDVVALESPSYFGYLDLIESLGLRVLEIPTHPITGLSLPALSLALDTQTIKAVLVAPTLSNPLGSIMPHKSKQQLVQLLAERGVPLIEDVVFNDLLAGDKRRIAAKSFDQRGLVMICGSFAKTLTPGIRLGWVEAGQWRDQVATRKRLHGAANAVVLEEALADLLSQGGYEAQMRRLSQQMTQRRNEARRIIAQHFPKGTRVSNPVAGDTLWLELRPGSSSMELFHRCAAEGITFGPGEFFTATDRYRNCLRLSLSGPWDAPNQRSLQRIGQIATQISEGLNLQIASSPVHPLGSKPAPA